MRKHIIMLSVLFLLNTSCTDQKKTEQFLPEPTETTIKEGDEEGNANAREEWIELMHSAAPGVNWRDIENKNTRSIGQYKTALKQRSQLRDEIEFSSGLKGEWYERGSNNQAGSILKTTYDPNTNEIYAISAGGPLWKGTLAGNDWEVVNQDYKFGRYFLNVSHPTEGTTRISASIGGSPHYSDDGGLTWNSASGVNSQDVLGGFKLMNDEIIMVTRINTRIELFKSNDYGSSYTLINTIFSGDSDVIDLTLDKVTNNVFLIEQIATNKSKIHQFNYEIEKFEIINEDSPLGFGNSRANLRSVVIEDTLNFYSYKRDEMLYNSTDTGKTWNVVNQMQVYPWNVGIMASNYDPGNLFFGAVELYKYNKNSNNTNWSQTNAWNEYYSDVENKLHADIMYMEEYLDQEGNPFILNSNHGGIYVSYDTGDSYTNISLEKLNVGQLYDVRTDPHDDFLIYAGTQDQGFLRGLGAEEEIIDMKQVISGDYGHITFSENGDRLWSVYPFGSVSYYHNPRNANGPSIWYEIESENESVWIPPIVESPDPTENSVYVAGGSVDGGFGSYMMKLTFNNFEIEATQFDFDFLNASGSEISAMEFNKFNSEKIYVLTTNGRFFKSEDGGQSFESKDGQFPTGNYLYGSCILSSKSDENTIYISGGGYSSPPVYVSYDGGESFTGMDEGLPSTLVFGLAANSDETALFAASEAGPYTYNFTDKTWEYLGGADAPNTRFWSVEYVQERDIVRYGTYGRGIWDFNIAEQPTSTDEIEAISNLISVYPNPADQYITIKNTSDGKIGKLEIFNTSGEKMLAQPYVANRLDISSLNSGTYFVTISVDNQIITKKITKI